MPVTTPEKFITLDVWGKSQGWIHKYIDDKDAKSLKTVALSSNGKQLLFYKVEAPGLGDSPAFTIDIPEADLSTVIAKVAGATVDNIPVFTVDGSIKDSKVKLSDLAKSADVTAEIAQKISQAGHMKKVVVTQLPNPVEADENTFYLMKIAQATGKDKYEVYTKIGAELVLIDDTSVNLDGYSTTAQMNEAITAKITAALQPVNESITKTLTDAKAYTDNAVTPVDNRLKAAETTVSNHITEIGKINSTLTSQDDRITSLESGVGGVNIATEQECLAAFNSVFYPKS